MNVARYIAHRLKQHGVDEFFGIPGTSCAGFFDEASKVGLRAVVTSAELEAGYAADGYARIKGLSAVCVSYGVGTLSLVNAIAGAFVERSPVVVVNGGPSARELWNERHLGALFSHSAVRPSVDLEVFSKVTAYSRRVERPADVPEAVDRAITVAKRESRPVYIEIPSDIWSANCDGPSPELVEADRPGLGSEAELAAEVAEALRHAKKPAVLLGAEIQRYGLADEALAVIRAHGLPFATTLLAKSVIDETVEGFIGTYDSDLAPKPVRDVIEDADLLLAFGVVFGVDHTALSRKAFDRTVHALDGRIRICRTAEQRGELAPFLTSLASLGVSPPGTTRAATRPSYASRRQWRSGRGSHEVGLTHEALFETVDDALSQGWFVVMDTCLGSYPGADLAVRGTQSFMANPVWLSIGHSVGAALGVAFAQEKPVLVICGDGGFQMTSMTLSTIARHKLKVATIVIDNGLYAIEQYLIDPKYFADAEHPVLPYVELSRWDYPSLAKAMGVPTTYPVSDVGALALALESASKHGGPSLISARVLQRDLPPENQPSHSLREVPERPLLDFCGLLFSAPTAGPVIRARDGSNWAVVVQKGRSFQRENPDVPVVVDKGRFLVVDLGDAPDIVPHPGCYAVEKDRLVRVGIRETQPAERDPVVQQLVDSIDATALLTMVQQLSSLYSRRSPMETFQPAVEMASAWLRDAGCEVSTQSVSLGTETTCNVVGVRRGSAPSPRLFIVGAHLDSVNHEDGPDSAAPGANDNASGVATVVAIAKSFAGQQLEHDVEFVLFGGEEQGLFGSTAYVAGLAEEDRARLGGVLTVDMAASQNTEVPTVLLEGAEVSRGVMEGLAVSASTYTDLVVQTSYQPYASDHVPFIDAGLPGVLTIEGADQAYPHEHTARDTPDKLTTELHRRITVMNLAWLAEHVL